MKAIRNPQKSERRKKFKKTLDTVDVALKLTALAGASLDFEHDGDIQKFSVRQALAHARNKTR